MKEQIKQGRQKILLFFEGSSEKIKVKEMRNVPYKNRALQELEQEQKLQKKDGFYFLTELGREELKKIQEQRLATQKIQQQIQEQKQLQINTTLQIFSEKVVKCDNILPLADIDDLFSKEEAKLIRRYVPNLHVSSRSVEAQYLTWFFTGDEKIASRKARAKVRLLAIEAWKNFSLEVQECFNIKLDIDLCNPKISVASIRKAIGEHIVSFHKISRELQKPQSVLVRMMEDLELSSIENPEGTRLYHKKDVVNNCKNIEDYYLVTTTHIAFHLKITLATVRRRLKKQQVTPYIMRNYQSYLYLWKDAKCLFSEPIPQASKILEQYKENRENFFREKRQKQQENIRKEQEKLLQLRNQVLAMFPIKFREERPPKVFLHVGPTNSGKTHGAIQHMQQADSGIYLAPLRLLAWEVFEKVNQEFAVCSLLTGEESIIHENSRFISATVEMFSSERSWDVVILDEAQMISDHQRGWAWTKVLAHVRTQELHICCAPEAEKLLQNFLTKLGYQTIHNISYQRLCPLKIATNSWDIEKPIAGTIFVVFRRLDALALKNYFEKKNISTSVIYGALPPDVRKKQAQRFIRGETPICVATDAIGMGINLPGKRICFTTLEKFDGYEQRLLTPEEMRQIAGRAGRFGYEEFGEVGTLSKENLHKLRKTIRAQTFERSIYIAPTIMELKILQGSLAKRLCLWKRMQAIPEEYSRLILPCNLDDRIDLASKINLEWEKELGLEKCFTLINAPVTKKTTGYWLQCVAHIAKQNTLPQPHFCIPKKKQLKISDLTELECFVKECEIYLWLSNREDFHDLASIQQKESVSQNKSLTSKKIDEILHKIIAGRVKKCKHCEAELPPLYPYGICSQCYSQRSFGWEDEFWH